MLSTLLYKLTHPSALYEGSELNAQFVILSLLHLVICFVLLGICASDYLCPTVSIISQGKSQKGILAAILLSWCNSSPDLFTNFMSWTSSNAASLSVGEVLGSCGFILCVVQGAILIVMAPINAQLEADHNRHVQRDLTFILMAMSMMLYVCLRNKVTLLNCTIMLSIYVGYIISKAGISLRNHQEQDDSYSMEIDATDEPDLNLKFSVLSALDYNALYSLMQKSSGLGGDEITLRTLNSGVSDVEYVAPRPLTAPGDTFRERPYYDRPMAHSSPSTFEAYHDEENASEMQSLEAVPIVYDRALHNRMFRLKNGMINVLAPQLIDFQHQSLPSKCIVIPMVPFTVLLRLSCPQHEKLLHDGQNSRKAVTLDSQTLILLLIQAIFAPLCSTVLVCTLLDVSISWRFMLATLIASIFLLAGILSLLWKVINYNKFSLNEISAHDERGLFKLMSLEQPVILVVNSIGILNCILWISMLANTLVEVMVLYQELTGISEAVLGLTIFSWGNSVSDLMSNVAMCKLHFKIEVENQSQRDQLASRYFFISLSACFGGILLNSLIGIGLSGFVSMLLGSEGVSENSFWFLRSVSLGSQGMDYKFILSVAFILTQNVVLLLFFSGFKPFGNFLARNFRSIGIFLCTWWALATVLNVAIETAGKKSS
ncbi:LANO_0E05996g1_1 [Lachancea nothofagi CBS 11611]|uniref:LANO_0E05996g1_1 n=1 Tax=Lachancea nothofagi CBS 11611 TaxID=1266666 RepID=A0A1G4JTV3_9SACH|nr:LANO_0E05996g1_1 [Lachancea nothofagi CBS 11611]